MSCAVEYLSRMVLFSVCHPFRLKRKRVLRVLVMQFEVFVCLCVCTGTLEGVLKWQTSSGKRLHQWTAVPGTPILGWNLTRR